MRCLGWGLVIILVAIASAGVFIYGVAYVGTTLH